MTLIIYDNGGKIFSQITGNYAVPQGGVQYLEVEVPLGKTVSGVNTTVTPHQATFEIVPPSPEDRLTAVENALLMII